jgi:hypothetical protein
MLSEEQVRDRAAYCYCVCLQLRFLLKNDLLLPTQYMDFLKRSSLQLGDDEFIKTTIEDGILSGLEDGGINNLIHLYEGFVYAFCEVLQTDVDSITEQISPEFLKQLADEMDARKDWQDDR